ncbi:MAG: phosphotransferase [Defluviitaleaceae bacterium]|nr:phosphotransferase [Defluviitaleaceae bacterium]MCL2240643.1 phosphotransferase [Defluviitaleaceae bacterium]
MDLSTVIATRSNKTIYRDGDKSIKLFEKGFSKADVLNEALNQARVEETELNIPKVLEVTMIEGRWAIVSEFIEGKTLSQLLSENPEKSQEYFDRLIELQIKVHKQRCPLLTKLRDKMFRKISLSEFDSSVKYELQTFLNGMPRHNKVCHGDFVLSNVVITPEDVPYIIDWSHATQGNAAADAARTYLMYLLVGRKNDAEYYINTFCEKNDSPRKYVEKWLRIVAASQSVKGNKDELEFLSRLVNVVDFM